MTFRQKLTRVVQIDSFYREVMEPEHLRRYIAEQTGRLLTEALLQTGVDTSQPLYISFRSSLSSWSPMHEFDRWMRGRDIDTFEMKLEYAPPAAIQRALGRPIPEGARREVRQAEYEAAITPPSEDERRELRELLG